LKLKSDLTKKGLLLIAVLLIVSVGVASASIAGLVNNNAINVEISEEDLPEEILSEIEQLQRLKEGKLDILKQLQEGAPEGGDIYVIYLSDGTTILSSNDITVEVSDEELPEYILIEIERLQQLKEDKLAVLSRFREGIPEGGEIDIIYIDLNQTQP
jgi:hypothetical protein